MRVGYCKLGRSLGLGVDSWGYVGGDSDAPILLKDLALRNPGIEWVLVGRNSGEVPQDVGYPPNVVNPWVEWGPSLRDAMRGDGLKIGGVMTEAGRRAMIACYDQLTGPTFDELDHVILWMGQHGSSNAPLPLIDAPSMTSEPQDCFVTYGSYITRGLNRWRDVDPVRREEIILIADARNYHKARDVKWPGHHPILGQFDFERVSKYERFGDLRTPAETGFGDVVTDVLDTKNQSVVWSARQQYVYSRLEMTCVTPGHVDTTFDDDWTNRRYPFGIFINEAKSNVRHSRLQAMQEYVAPLGDMCGYVHGTWSKESQKKLGFEVYGIPWEDFYPMMRAARCTLTTPSSGSGWATSKPWQAFLCGSVCFFHPEYDTQDHILADAHPELRSWLRVGCPEDLRQRVEYLNSEAGRTTWEWLVAQQRAHWEHACDEHRLHKMIERRIYAREQ